MKPAKTQGKFIAYITVDYKPVYLGTFDSIDLAAEARREAEARYWHAAPNTPKPVTT